MKSPVMVEVDRGVESKWIDDLSERECTIKEFHAFYFSTVNDQSTNRQRK